MALAISVSFLVVAIILFASPIKRTDPMVAAGANVILCVSTLLMAALLFSEKTGRTFFKTF